VIRVVSPGFLSTPIFITADYNTCYNRWWNTGRKRIVIYVSDSRLPLELKTLKKELGFASYEKLLLYIINEYRKHVPKAGWV